MAARSAKTALGCGGTALRCSERMGTPHWGRASASLNADFWQHVAYSSFCSAAGSEPVGCPLSRYALSRWCALMSYTEDGKLEIDNTAVGRALHTALVTWAKSIRNPPG